MGFCGVAVSAQTAPSAAPAAAPATGAQGRGVRIIAPDAPPTSPVANAPQATPTVAPANALPPAPTTMAGPRPPLAGPPVLKACERPFARPTLHFADPAGFDAKLRSKLRGGQSVVVDFESPYPAGNEAPAPIGAWLNEIQKTGGAVTVDAYCVKGRGFGQFFAKLFGGGPAEPYKAARRYDAVLHVDSVDQVVTQIEFTRRKAAR
jgi:hypothetical protein